MYGAGNKENADQNHEWNEYRSENAPQCRLYFFKLHTKLDFVAL